MTAPIFTVTKGHPTEDEIAALTAVFAQLASAATSSAASEREPNLWGRPALSGHPHVYNPGAFANINYF